MRISKNMIAKIWEVKGYKAPPPPTERTLKILFSPELGTTDKVTVLASFIPPGGTTGLHSHDVDEIIYIASGRGVYVEGDKEHPVEPDVVLYAPAKVAHEVRNTGDETIKLLCVYVPPVKPSEVIMKAIEAAKGST